MNKQWKVGLSIVALTAGMLMQAYAADDSLATNSNNSMSKSGAMTSSDKMAMVNVNTANADQLKAIKGLDEKQAKAIIAYREKNGNFKAIEDLRKVSGIDDKVLAMIKPQVTVGS